MVTLPSSRMRVSPRTRRPAPVDLKRAKPPVGTSLRLTLIEKPSFLICYHALPPTDRGSQLAAATDFYPPEILLAICHASATDRLHELTDNFGEASARGPGKAMVCLQRSTTMGPGRRVNLAKLKNAWAQHRNTTLGADCQLQSVLVLEK